MYAVTDSAEGDCYLSVPPNPSIEAVALGASASAAPGAGESALSGTAPTEALHTFTLDSGASRSYFRDSTTLTPLSQPVAVSLADPSGGPVLAHSSTVLPCLAAPSGLLSGLHLPSFSTNLRVTHCTCSRTGRHLATFTRPPGSSLYTLTNASPPVTTSGEVAASTQVFAAAFRSSTKSAPCSCRPLSHETLLWHHRLGHPSLPCLRAHVRGQGHERYFLLVVDDYSRYTIVFPLRSKDRGGEFSSDLLRAFCRAEGIRQTFTLPASPQKNGTAERRIGMINLRPRVSLPETTPTLRWTGKVGDACVFRVWGSRAFVRDTSADKLSSRAIPCVFFGFPPDAPGWKFYHPTSRRNLSSQDVTFDEGVGVRVVGIVVDSAVDGAGRAVPEVPCVDSPVLGFPPPPDGLLMNTILLTAPPPPSPLRHPFLCVSHEDPAEPVEVAVDSGAARGAEPAGAGTGGAEPGVSMSVGAGHGGAEPECVEHGGAESGSAEPGGAESGGLPARRCRGAVGAAGAGAAGGASGAAGGAAGAGVAGTAGAGAVATGDTSGAGAAGGTGARGAAGVVGGDPGAKGTGAISAVSGGAARPRPYYILLLQQILGLPPSPGRTPPLLSPPPVQSTSQLQPTSLLPRPSPYSGPTRGLTEPREPDSRPVSPESRPASPESRSALPVRTARASRRASHPRPPPVPVTHSMTSYLGLRITQDRAQRTITLTQSHMVQHVLQRFGFTYSLPQSTPLPTGHSLSAPPSDESVEPSGPYPELVGCLMYLMTCTRPDLAYPLSLLACYVAPDRHRKVRWDDAKRVLRYLCSTSGMGLVLGGRARVVLTRHADASWVDDLATLRSTQGYTFSLGSVYVSWRSTRSSSVLSSSCEAEIYAGAMAAKELRWLMYLLIDLGEAPRSPLVLYANTADVFTKALQPCDHQLAPAILRTTQHWLRFGFSRLLATAVTDPSFESTAASALVAELLDFAAACRLDYTTALVAESVSASPPSVGGDCALGTDVLEDRQEDFECLVAAVPRFASMLLAPEGDPDAPDIPTPRSYAEAITGLYSSQWQAAMDAEMASWKSTGTYVDEVPPPGANIVDGMWIFRVKRPPGSPPAFKARYVARGFSQGQGVDYFQTFSPTPKMTTHRVLLHVTAQRDYELHSLDFSTDFLQGSLHEEIWLRRPSGFTVSFPTGTQWSLRRPVYGLRQAPREWHDTLRTTLAALGFAPATADSSLFLCTDTLLPPFYVLAYVLQRLGFQFSLPQATPLSTSHSLSAPPSDEYVEPSGPYPELVGCLMYLITCSQPDLAYPLSLLARYVAPGRHRKVHWDAAKRVLRYLCNTSGMGLLLGGRGPVVLTGLAHTSWSTRSSSILSSSCEAEIHAGAMAAEELRWLTYLQTDLGEWPRSPPVLYVDNKAMIALCQVHRQEHRIKHIALRYFLARELQQRRQLSLAYVATRANTADIFTKVLPPGDHQRFSYCVTLLVL
ncbi:unnamed protein product [Closterium sp. NIES-53]